MLGFDLCDVVPASFCINLRTIGISALALELPGTTFYCTDTGIKNGPRGYDHNNFSGGSIVEIKPGLLPVTFEESIHHTGAPWRISLSGKQR